MTDINTWTDTVQGTELDIYELYDLFMVGGISVSSATVSYTDSFYTLHVMVENDAVVDVIVDNEAPGEYMDILTDGHDVFLDSEDAEHADTKSQSVQSLGWMVEVLGRYRR